VYVNHLKKGLSLKIITHTQGVKIYGAILTNS